MKLTTQQGQLCVEQQHCRLERRRPGRTSGGRASMKFGLKGLKQFKVLPPADLSRFDDVLIIERPVDQTSNPVDNEADCLPDLAQTGASIFCCQNHFAADLLVKLVFMANEGKRVAPPAIADRNVDVRVFWHLIMQ